MKKTLLILDDDLKLCDLLVQGLSNDFEITVSSDADIAFNIATKTPPNIILLDIHLGAGSGIDFCRKLRANQLTRRVPVLIFTGFGTTEKMIQSFDGGADDYIEKPVDMSILRQRLHSRLKRMDELSSDTQTFENLKLFPERSEIELDGKIHKLSEIEFDLLRIFLTHPNKKISREEILKTVWRDTQVTARTVDVHVSSLRKKLKNFNHDITALYGRGYILRPVDSSQDI